MRICCKNGPRASCRVCRARVRAGGAMDVDIREKTAESVASNAEAPGSLFWIDNDRSVWPMTIGKDLEDAARERALDEKLKCADVSNALAPMGEAPRFIDRMSSELRKQFPMSSGFVDYFPDAMAAVSHISWVGNQKHNPGKPLHHARGKSTDHDDCIIRHHSTRDNKDPVYANDVIAGVFHAAEEAWRAMAQLQEKMERVYNLGLPKGARED